jgi:hypothetical protein
MNKTDALEWQYWLAGCGIACIPLVGLVALILQDKSIIA